MASAPLIVDYSFARPSPEVIAGAGMVGVARYLCPLPNPKALTSGEVVALRGQGLSISMVWESGSQRPLAGAGAGVADAREANHQADTLGAPANTCVFYAVDFDADPKSILEYFRGVGSFNGRPVGVYGSYRVVEAILAAGLAAHGWQTGAWSGGRRSTRACLYQRTSSSPVPGTDLNDCQFPDWGQWPRPNVQEDDLPKTSLAVDSQGSVFALTLGAHHLGKAHISNPDRLKDLLSLDNFLGHSLLASQVIGTLSDLYLAEYPTVTNPSNVIAMSPEEVKAIAEEVAQLCALSKADIDAIVAAFGAKLGTPVSPSPSPPG